MTRIYLLVEGQTEEAFVNELLVPHYSGVGLYLTPIIVSTSSGHKGGVVSYPKVRPQIERLCKQDAAAYVSTMFDLYALPRDFPGKSSRAYPEAASGSRKADFLETELAKDIGQRNFIPNLLVHEFEALLFARVDAFEAWTDDDRVLDVLRITREQCGPEEINERPQLAPSKRILAAWARYQKTVHGPLIACDVGLDAMRTACPHFNGWLHNLEAIVK